MWIPLQEPLFFPLDENLVGLETQIASFLDMIQSAKIRIAPGLVHSLEAAPPKNLNILLIRIFRDAGLQPVPENELYFDVKNQALNIFGMSAPSPPL